MHTWLALLRSRLRQGRCCVDLHYGTVLGGEFWPSFLRNLAFTNERAFPKQSHKVIRHNADPVSCSTYKKPSRALPLKVWGVARCPRYLTKIFYFSVRLLIKKQEVQRTLKAETRCMFYTIQTIFRLARPAVLSVLRLTVTFFIIYSLSRNNEHPTSSTCPPAC